MARIFLDISGLLNVFFGLVYLAFPALMTEPAGLTATSPTGLTDVRAIYGGLQIGWGAFEIWTARRPSRFEGGLVCTVLMCAALAACRWTGVALAGELSWVDRRALGIETGYLLLSLWVWWRHCSGHPAP